MTFRVVVGREAVMAAGGSEWALGLKNSAP
jgi:hypothetical protein